MTKEEFANIKAGDTVYIEMACDTWGKATVVVAYHDSRKDGAKLRYARRSGSVQLEDAEGFYKRVQMRTRPLTLEEIPSKRWIVRCIETDERQNSIYKASKAWGISETALTESIRYGTKLHGRTYERVRLSKAGTIWRGEAG